MPSFCVGLIELSDVGARVSRLDGVKVGNQRLLIEEGSTQLIVELH